VPAHGFQCLMIQPARIVFSHCGSESAASCSVKKKS
jgi:hypothetical protein